MDTELRAAADRAPIVTNDFTPSQRDELPLGIISLDRNGKILAYNRCEADHARRAPEETVGRSFFAIAPCANDDSFKGRFERFGACDDDGFETFTFTYPFRWGARDVEITFCRRRGHVPIDMITTSRGLTTLDSPTRDRDLEARIVRLNRQAARRVRYIEPEAVWREDLRAQTIEWSNELHYLCDLGVERAVPARGILAFAHPEEAVEIGAVVDAAVAAGRSYALEVRIVTPLGNERIVAVRGTVMTDRDGRATSIHGRATDMTAERRDDEELWRLANLDNLTNIGNRLRFETCLEAELDDTRNLGRRFAIVVIDLDHFKPINDTFGHLVGDDVLKAVAHRLERSIRPQDIVARLGGDEFAILIRDLKDDATLTTLDTRVKEALAEAIVVGKRSHHISASIGISTFPENGRDAKTLLRAADLAMYDGKRAGDGEMVRYDTGIETSRRAYVAMQRDIATALENSEFELYLQDVVDSSTHALVGAEGLLRWNHGTRGIVAPGEFIPILEKNGMILPVGAWVIETACAQIRATMEAGHPLPISVNVSLVQFRFAGFIDTVRHCLEVSKIEPHLLILELTESVASNDFDRTVVTLIELRTLGVSLALDDFGTGYSSLAHLKYFPINSIKLDRVFVANSANDPQDRAIAETILRLADKLELRVIAEGIETAEQATCMRELGCESLQGFLFGRPRPAREFLAVLGATVD